METRQEVAAETFSGRATETTGPESRASRFATVANDLALLVAHEAARADKERRRREEIEMTASQLAVLIAHEHAELERERTAREQAEAEASQLRRLLDGKERFRRDPLRGRRLLARH